MQDFYGINHKNNTKMQSLLNKTHVCEKSRRTSTKKRLSFFCNSPEIGFCKALIICDLDGRLLLQGMEYREGEIAKEVARALIFVADFVFCGVTKSYFYNQKKQEK